MNPGGIRARIEAGPVTWGELFTSPTTGVVDAVFVGPPGRRLRRPGDHANPSVPDT